MWLVSSLFRSTRQTTDGSSALFPNSAKETLVIRVLTTGFNRLSEMMALDRRRTLFLYLKFILGTAALFGILISIGEINAYLQR